MCLSVEDIAMKLLLLVGLQGYLQGKFVLSSPFLKQCHCYHQAEIQLKTEGRISLTPILEGLKCR